jgi:energy-coupling factor transport system substrate-specific component
VKLIAAAAVSAAALATPAQLAMPAASPLLRLVPRPTASLSPLPSASKFLQAHQQGDGGFAEAGGGASPSLTAWAALGLAAAGADPGDALEYLRAHEHEVREPAALALVALAEAALGDMSAAKALSLRPRRTNVVTWTILALRQAGRPAPPALVQTLRSRQLASGGWGWARGIAADSNDTAAAVQALRACGIRGRPIDRALGYLRGLRNRDGGFTLVPGRSSDAQSTAWAVQAFLAAGAPPPPGALAYLRALRRADGSYRYSRRYATTPVWVTSQVLPALARKPFPLRPG